MAVIAKYLIPLTVASFGLAIENVPLLRNKTLILHCAVENISQIFQDDILWAKNGESLPYWTDKPIYRQDQAQVDDSGVYTCNVTGGMQQVFDVIVGDIPIARSGRRTLYCPEVAVNRSNSSYILWSKDAEMFVNKTDLTFTVIASQFTDGGYYTCNNSGTEKTYAIVVGEKPTKPPTARCLQSPNTTITCSSIITNSQSNELCMNVYRVSWAGSRSAEPLISKCTKDGIELHISVDLDHQLTAETRCYIKTVVSNDFGSSFSEKEFYLAYFVTPDPPVNVKLERTGEFSFKGSFDVPNSWKVASKLKFNYSVIEKATGDEKTIRPSLFLKSENRKTATFNVNVNGDLPPYTLVCMTVKISFDHGNAVGWSKPSQAVCNHTEEKAPSKGPQSVTLMKDVSEGAHRAISLQWQPPPEDARNGVIVSYGLVIIETSTEVEILRVTLPGNETEWSNTSALLDPYKEYLIELTASTSKGHSPVISYPLIMALTPRNIALIVIIVVSCLAGFILVAAVGWKVERKIHPRHLPEPFLIPENQMQFLLSRKGPLPKQKEVFDDLRSPPPAADEQIEVKPEENNNTEYESQTERTATNEEVSPPLDDGYIRRNSRELVYERRSGSFSDAYTERTSVDLTPTQVLMFHFSDTELPKSCINTGITCYQTEPRSTEGTVHGSDYTIVPNTSPADSQYIAKDDVRLQARLDDSRRYENYIPFEKKVIETMRNLNAKC
ncbi:Roundabout-like 1 [Holothuria leucospilota]|uniref:Roundabout-like 1 n=1 Tax=Holothuria leucospilota TaxID=206669 RepID=A0A9Q1C0M6_HOLLE|nr:Roundabout-like 1 [Holothuria leucospilota]